MTTLLFETLAWAKAYSFPAGVTVSGLSLILALATFFGVSWLTRDEAEGDLDADVRVIIES